MLLTTLRCIAGKLKTALISRIEMRLVGFVQDHLDEPREDHDDLVLFHLDQFSVKGFTAIGAMYLDHGLLVSSGIDIA